MWFNKFFITFFVEESHGHGDLLELHDLLNTCYQIGTFQWSSGIDTEISFKINILRTET